MKRPITAHAFHFALLSLIFVLSACDSGGSNDVSNNFTFEVISFGATPEVRTAKTPTDTTISGFSFFYSGENSEGEEVFGIYLSENESFSGQDVQQGLFGFVARNSERPSEGTYDLTRLGEGVASGDFIGALYTGFSETNFRGSPFYIPQRGSVTIDKSSSDEVVGSVNLTATAVTSSDSSRVNISGDFTAKSVENFVPLTTPSN